MLGGEGPGPYSWWSWRGKAFDTDTGWRIDYQLANPGLAALAREYRIDRAPSWGERWSNNVSAYGYTVEQHADNVVRVMLRCSCGAKFRFGPDWSHWLAPDELLVKAMGERAIATMGHVDILVNAAAEPGGYAPVPALADVKGSFVDEEINIKRPLLPPFAAPASPPFLGHARRDATTCRFDHPAPAR